MSHETHHNAYGHVGGHLEHIIVCAPHVLRPPIPPWEKMFLVTILLAVSVFFSRFTLPPPPLLTNTVIDISKLNVKIPPAQPKPIINISKLTVKPPPAPPKPVILQPEENIRPPESSVKSLPKPEIIPEPAVSKITPRRSDIPAPQATNRPSVSRSLFLDYAPDINVTPRIVERRQVDVAVARATSPTIRLRRETAEAATQPDATAAANISRNRGVTGMTAMESSTAPQRIAATRRTNQAGVADGNVPAERPSAIRTVRVSAPLEEKAATPVATTHERTKLLGGAEESKSTVALARGVSLMSLKICASSLQQEEAIKAVLSVVGSRQSCSNEKGTFQFKGTKRVSSFNLIIFPVQGREPSHRCEELEHAYSCLQKN